MTPRHRESRRSSVPPLGALAVGLVLAVTPASAVHHSRVLVVTSNDLPQYRQPVEAFVAAHTGDVRVIDIGGSKESGRDRIRRAVAEGPVDAVFAVGAQAAWISRDVLPDVPLTFAMVIDWQRYGLGANASGHLRRAARSTRCSRASSFCCRACVASASSPATKPRRRRSPTPGPPPRSSESSSYARR